MKISVFCYFLKGITHKIGQKCQIWKNYQNDTILPIGGDRREFRASAPLKCSFKCFEKWRDRLNVRWPIGHQCVYSDFLEIWKVTFFQAQSIGDRREGKGGRTEFAEQIKGLKEPEKDLKNRKPT